MEFNDKCVLIAGIIGFIASKMAKQLVEEGAKFEKSPSTEARCLDDAINEGSVDLCR